MRPRLRTSIFDPIGIGNFQGGFVDGATGTNNPVGEVWDQPKDLWSLDRVEGHLECLVSIATGVPGFKPFGRHLREISATLLLIATKTEKTAEKFARRMPSIEDKGKCYRFNILTGLEAIGLEDSSKKQAIIAARGQYLEFRAVHNQLRQCVVALRSLTPILAPPELVQTLVLAICLEQLLILSKEHSADAYMR